MGVEIRLDMKGFSQAVKEMPDKTYARMKPVFMRIGDIFMENFIKPGRTGNPGVRMRSGGAGLAGSFKRIVIGSSIQSLMLMIFTNSKYARIHEKGSKGLPGGVIKPKKGKYLAIPLDAAKTKAKVGRELSPRNMTLSFGGFSKKGNPLLRTVDGIPMFVLVKSVKIKARLGMFRMWGKQNTKNVRILNTAVGEVLRRF